LTEIPCIQKSDCAIERCHQDWPGEAVLLDGYANKVFSVPAAWPDDYIWQALELVNGAFKDGFKAGEAAQSAKIRRLIGAAPAGDAI